MSIATPDGRTFLDVYLEQHPAEIAFVDHSGRKIEPPFPQGSELLGAVLQLKVNTGNHAKVQSKHLQQNTPTQTTSSGYSTQSLPPAQSNSGPYYQPTNGGGSYYHHSPYPPGQTQTLHSADHVGHHFHLGRPGSNS